MLPGHVQTIRPLKCVDVSAMKGMRQKPRRLRIRDFPQSFAVAEVEEGGADGCAALTSPGRRPLTVGTRSLALLYLTKSGLQHNEADATFVSRVLEPMAVTQEAPLEPYWVPKLWLQLLSGSAQEGKGRTGRSRVAGER